MRYLAFGHSDLMEGFALMGFETLACTRADEFEQQLKQLMQGSDQALIYVEQGLYRQQSELIKQAEKKLSHILLMIIPSMTDCLSHAGLKKQRQDQVCQSQIEDEIDHLLGGVHG